MINPPKGFQNKMGLTGWKNQYKKLLEFIFY